MSKSKRNLQVVPKMPTPTSVWGPADDYVTGLESEARANPKAFYGSASTPHADGLDRVRGALTSVTQLRDRLEQLNRG